MLTFEEYLNNINSVLTEAQSFKDTKSKGNFVFSTSKNYSNDAMELIEYTLKGGFLPFIYQFFSNPRNIQPAKQKLTHALDIIAHLAVVAKNLDDNKGIFAPADYKTYTDMLKELF